MKKQTPFGELEIFDSHTHLFSHDFFTMLAKQSPFPDRIFGGFFFNPLQEKAIERAKHAFDDLRLKMICLFPAMHGFSVGDNETVKEIAELVKTRKGTAIFVHCEALSVGIRGKIGLKSPFDLLL